MFHSGREMSLMVKTNSARHGRPGSPTRKEGETGCQAVSSSPTAVENEVAFQTADGRELHARLARLTRHAATFEADDLAATLRTSEVLANFKITAGGRVIYFGRAVVSNVLHTGDSLLCEAKLDDLGSDTAFFLPRAGSG